MALHIILKLQKTKDKENVVKAVRIKLTNYLQRPHYLEVSLPGFKAYYKATVTKTVWHEHTCSQTGHWNRIQVL